MSDAFLRKGVVGDQCARCPRFRIPVISGTSWPVEPKKRSRAWIGCALLALFVQYPLSTGLVLMKAITAKRDPRRRDGISIVHARLALQVGLALMLRIVGLVSGLAAGGSFPGTTIERPNILILLVDDLGIGDPGCYNRASKIRTPHIDRIAREGMRFTDAHSSSSVCSPTRYAILTGRYAWRGRLKSGVLNGYSRALIEPGRPTIASVLKEHGYATAGIGKWHLGFQGFEPRAPRKSSRSITRGRCVRGH